eukprot:364009-Chlamydomonas_euryale.AAC.13
MTAADVRHQAEGHLRMQRGGAHTGLHLSSCVCVCCVLCVCGVCACASACVCVRVCARVLHHLNAQPPPAQWIRQGHPAQTPSVTTTTSKKRKKEREIEGKGHKGRTGPQRPEGVNNETAKGNKLPARHLPAGQARHRQRDGCAVRCGVTALCRLAGYTSCSRAVSTVLSTRCCRCPLVALLRDEQADGGDVKGGEGNASPSCAVAGHNGRSRPVCGPCGRVQPAGVVMTSEQEAARPA